MGHHEARLAAVLALFLAALAQTHTGLQLVIIDSIIADDKEIVLFVALGGFVLDVPVVFPCHQVFILVLFHVSNSLVNITFTLFQRLIRG